MYFAASTLFPARETYMDKAILAFDEEQNGNEIEIKDKDASSESASESKLSA